MPTEMTGISIEPRQAKMVDLFEVRKIAFDEIEARAKLYLKEVGYDWYRVESLTVSKLERSGVTLIHITAALERSYQTNNVDIEVPLKQFEALVKR